MSKKVILILLLVLIFLIEFGIQANILLGMPEEKTIDSVKKKEVLDTTQGQNAIAGVRTYIKKLKSFRPGNQNPFYQPGDDEKEAALPLTEAQKLKAIIVGPSIRVALFGNTFYAVGDSIGNRKIADIKPDHVMLLDSSGSKTKLVPIPE